MNNYSKQKLNKQRNKRNESAKLSVSPCLLIKPFRRLATKFSTESIPKCTHISLYKSFDIVRNILYTILFTENCNECLSAEFVGQTSEPYKRIGKHFDLINSNITSSDVILKTCSQHMNWSSRSPVWTAGITVFRTAAAAEVRRVRRWRCTAIKCCRSCHGTACDFGVRNRKHRLCCT